MRIRGARELRRSNRGNMPFALIAVALLLTTATFCVVYANIEQKEEEAESITAELSTIDDAIAGVEFGGDALRLILLLFDVRIYDAECGRRQKQRHRYQCEGHVTLIRSAELPCSAYLHMIRFAVFG